MRVISHSKHSNVNSLVIELAKTIGVKQSRMKELHGKSMGFNSYNHLISTAKKRTIQRSTRKYATTLSKLLKDNHQIEATSELWQQITKTLDQWIKKFTLSIKFIDYISYFFFTHDPMYHQIIDKNRVMPKRFISAVYSTGSFDAVVGHIMSGEPRDLNHLRAISTALTGFIVMSPNNNQNKYNPYLEFGDGSTLFESIKGFIVNAVHAQSVIPQEISDNYL